MNRPTPELVPLPSTGRPEAYGPDPNAPLTQAVAALARERGELDAAGRVDLSGLVVKQGDLTYMVNQRVLTNQVTKTRVAGKRLGVAGRRVRPLRPAEAPHFHRGILRRQREEYTVEEQTSVIDLNVVDANGNLVSVTSFDGSKIDAYERGKKADFLEEWPDGTGEFLLFLASHGPKPEREFRENWASRSGFQLAEYLRPEGDNMTLPRGPVQAIGWGPKPDRPPAELPPNRRQTIGLPSMDGVDNVLERVIEYREHLNLPDDSLVGLTFMEGTHKLQITGDRLLLAFEGQGRRWVRIWQITEYDEHGRPIKQQKVRDAAMSGLLNKRQKMQPDKSLYTDFHWEISNKTFGQALHAEQRERAVTAGPHKLTIDEACEVLSHPDLYDDETVRQKAAELKADPRQYRVALSLRGTVAKYGTARVSRVAEGMQEAYAQALGRLGLPAPAEENASLSWTLRAVAEERYWMHHPDLAEEKRRTDDFGIKVGDPMLVGPEGLRKRREIVDYQVGLTFIESILKPGRGRRPVEDVDRGGFVETKEKAELVFHANQELVDRLESFVKPKIGAAIGKFSNQLLHDLHDSFKPTSDEVPASISDIDPKILSKLDRAEVVELGRLLRRQFMS